MSEAKLTFVHVALVGVILFQAVALVGIREEVVEERKAHIDTLKRYAAHLDAEIADQRRRMAP